MNHKASIQIQAVIYHNDKVNLIKTLENIHNALRIESTHTNQIGTVDFVFGDASAVPTFSDREIAEISERYKDHFNFHYRFFHENTGFGKGQNILGNTCQSDYIVVMNPDIIVTPRFFIEMLAPFDQENVGMTEARQTPIEHHKAYDFNTFETAWATMACIMVRTDLWHALKGIDADTFFMYCEDVDFSWRIRMLGYKIIYCPKAVVYHAKRIGATAKHEPSYVETFHSSLSNILMAHKWSNPAREKEMLELCRNGNSIQQEAAEKFLELERNGLLPTPIDPQHTVAFFKDGYYAENRFVWDFNMEDRK